jgi:predicted secreted protein
MSLKEIKEQFHSIICNNQEKNPYELRRIFNEVMREWEMNRGWDESERGEPWTDDELRMILSDAPTKENCLKHARGFKRGYGSIEQIYRWAATPGVVIEEKRPDDIFIKQIKRVAKQLGWRA